jgi:hypothetical protein
MWRNKSTKVWFYEEYKALEANVLQLLNHIYKHVEVLKTLMVEKFQIVTVS